MSTTKSNKPLVRKQKVIEEEPVEDQDDQNDQEVVDEKGISKGRKKKYASDEERKVARRIQQREYRVRKAQELAKLRTLYNKDQRAKKDKTPEIVEEPEPVIEEPQE